MKRKSASRASPAQNYKQTTLFQYSSPEKPKASSSKNSNRIPPPAYARKGNKSRPITVDEYDSDSIQAIKMEKPESSSSSSSGSDSDSSSDDDDDDDSEPVPTPRIKKPAPIVVNSDSEDSDDQPPLRNSSKRQKKLQISNSDDGDSPPPKRRRLTRKKTAAVRANSTDEDLDSDCIIESRFRKRGKLSNFQKSLEKYKKHKQKQEVSDSDENSEEEESESEDYSRKAKPFKGAKPNPKKDSLFGSDPDEGDDGDHESEASESEAESDFIVEDDPRSAPILPAMFSMETHQDLAHQFKKIFQLFVHVAVQAKNKRRKHMEKLLEDEYFSVPLMVARRKLSGLKDSLVASSVWKPNFKKALELYPQFELIMLDFSVPGCHACNLGQRISTRRGALSGRPYDRLGFRDRKLESEERKLPKQFDLGRFCATRTQVFHEFSHWEYHTFEVIEQEIEQVRTARKEKKGRVFYTVSWAGGKMPPDDLTDADGFCDWLDQRNIIEMEWRKVKELMERARKLDVESKRGDQD
ncbi:hypothetical protein FA15DRAFT_752092 [Coprinopsis marcescibilis]|uniref:DUF4211 domain-containing protein n=1 Tax=Coprinopsis marcescibilis TaxID=230819 RepID=A0A5C3LBH6_COPMA|nr:hypothetical protein FA15DRAFT_752092 [Coprinopsis marcescibilis]